jgi:inner membrane protease ATP23
MLSGECRFLREFFDRKQYKITEQFQECVRRRATASMLNRPQLKGDHNAASEVVNAVWGSCFADTRPFDEVYR